METRSNEAFLLYGNSTIQEYLLPSKIIQAFLLYKHQWIFYWILHLCCSHSDKCTLRLANFSWKWSILQYFSALSNNIVIRIVWRSNLHYGKLSDVNTICQKQFGHAFICVFAWLYHIMKFNTVATMPHIASRLIQWRWLNSPQQERKKEKERKKKKERKKEKERRRKKNSHKIPMCHQLNEIIISCFHIDTRQKIKIDNLPSRNSTLLWTYRMTWFMADSWPRGKSLFGITFFKRGISWYFWYYFRYIWYCFLYYFRHFPSIRAVIPLLCIFEWIMEDKFWGVIENDLFTKIPNFIKNGFK